MIYSNNSNETLAFKSYSASSNKVVDLINIQKFEINGLMGNAELPYVWTNLLLSNQAEIISYEISGQISKSIQGTNISIVMPKGTNLTALTANFTLSEYATAFIGITPQESGATVNNFSTPLDYRVVAQDGTEKLWTITVTNSLGNHENSILAFSLPNQTGQTIINPNTKTIDVAVEYGVDRTILVATFTLSDFAQAYVNNALQTSGTTANNFSNPLVYKVVAENGEEQLWTVTVTNDLNHRNEITAFNLPNQQGQTVINSTAKTIDIAVEYGIDRSNLVATFSLSDFAQAYVNNALQTSGTTANDFTNPLVYKVVAENGEEQLWIITVSNALNHQNEIISFNLPRQRGNTVINNSNSTIYVVVEYGVNRSNLVPTFSLSENAQAYIDEIQQVSEITGNNYTLPLVYKVVAQNGSIRYWTVIVSNDLNHRNEILSFLLPQQYGQTTINHVTRTVEIALEYGVARSSLVAVFALPEHALAYVDGILQVSGFSTNDFTNPVEYRVVAQNSDVQLWTVKVNNALNHRNNILDFTLPHQTGQTVFNLANRTVDIVVEYGIDRSSLIANFSLPDFAKAYIGEVEQLSGVTANDFKNPVEYRVVAQNGDIKQWTVAVSNALNDQNDILDFTLPFLSGEVANNKDNHSIELAVDYGTDLSNLVATFSISPDASVFVNDVLQVNGVTPNDFSQPVTYKIVAQNGSAQNWLVSVKFTFNHRNDILAFSISQQISETLIDFEKHSVELTVGANTDITNLIAAFALSDFATAHISNVKQESGVTANDYSRPVTYQVIAQNGNTQDWTIQVNTATSSEYLFENGLTIYPNPARDYIKIYTPEKIESITLIDLSGRRVLKTSLSTIDVSQFETGIFIVEVSTHNNRYLRKIVIKK
jgi:hypothetical protein